MSGYDPGVGRFGSFEDWSDFIRRAVLWIGSKGWLEVSDPVKTIAENFKSDPETEKLGKLLNAWLELFGGRGGTVGDALQHAKTDENFSELLSQVAGDEGQLSARKLGNWIRTKKERIVTGLRFVTDGTRQNYANWIAQAIPDLRESCDSRESAPTLTWEMAGDIYTGGGEIDSSNSQDSHAASCAQCRNFIPNRLCEFHENSNHGAECPLFEHSA